MGNFDVMAVLPFLLIFGVFYFLILRPQQQKMKKHQAMLVHLRRGDRVVSDTEVQLEIADDIRIRHVRSMISEVLAKTDPIDSSTNIASGSNLVSPIERKGGASKSKVSSKAAANRSKGKA
jgi:preprotein translocase subunit YajC